jgi:hypothetical protein
VDQNNIALVILKALTYVVAGLDPAIHAADLAGLAPLALG